MAYDTISWPMVSFNEVLMFVCVPYLVCLILCLCLRLRLCLCLLDSAFVGVGDMLCKE